MARPKESDRCEACVNGKSAVDATLCKRWRLVKKRQAKGKESKAKKLSAEAAGMPDQPARGGPRVGEYNEDCVVDEWQSTGRESKSSCREVCDINPHCLRSVSPALFACPSTSSLPLTHNALSSSVMAFSFCDQAREM
jgi:hypothetical protein